MELTDTTTGLPLAGAQLIEHDKQALLGGDEPFTDSTLTQAEAAARKLERLAIMDKELEREQRSAARALVRRGTGPAADLARSISSYSFQSELTPAELARCKDLFFYYGSRGRGNPGKPARKFVYVGRARYARVQMLVGKNLTVFCTKGLGKYSEAFRIADLVIYLFWKYRSPGNMGAAIDGSQHLNLSWARLETDLQSEAGLVKLIEAYRQLLIDSGDLSTKATAASVKSAEATLRRHNATRLTNEVAALRTAVAENKASSDHVFEALQACSTTVEVHKKNLITAMQLINNLMNRVDALEAK